MLGEMCRALFFIFIAEMGDKTQILAMAFATRYKTEKVLMGVLIGSFLNHGLAVLLGVYLTSVLPIHFIQLVASFSFIGFGLWTLHSQKEEEGEDTKSKLGPMVTVAAAFFIGELGDKTQLMAISLSTEAKYPYMILMGTTLGMVLVSSVGILVGSRVGKKVPEFAVKMISAGIFLFFGVIGVLQKMPRQYVTLVNVGIFVAILTGIVWILLKPLLEERNNHRITPFQHMAATLHIHTEQIGRAVAQICLGEEYCGKCKGKGCMIGFAKAVISSSLDSNQTFLPQIYNKLPEINQEKQYDLLLVADALAVTLSQCFSCGTSHNKQCVASKTREALEMICFGETIPFHGMVSQYLFVLRKKDETLGKRVTMKLEELLFENSQAQETV